LNLIDTGLFQQLLLVVVLSMLVTPVISQLAQRLATIPVDQKEASQEPPAPEPVVIAGFGRVGRTLLLISTPRSCCGNAQTDIEFSMATCGAPKSYVLPALPMRSS
jgi:di/tricarboxylate transporter